MTTDRFFSYSAENGYETHATAEAARRRVNDDIAAGRDDGWGDSMDWAAWGKIHERAVCILHKSLEEYEADGDERQAARMRAEGWDFLEDYELRPVEATE